MVSVYKCTKSFCCNFMNHDGQVTFHSSWLLGKSNVTSTTCNLLQTKLSRMAVEIMIWTKLFHMWSALGSSPTLLVWQTTIKDIPFGLFTFKYNSPIDIYTLKPSATISTPGNYRRVDSKFPK